MSPWWEEGWQRAPRLGGTRRQAATAPSWQCPTDSRTSQEPSLEKFSRSLDVTAQPLAYCCLDTDAALNPRPAGGHDGGRLAGMMVGGRLWVTVFLFPHLCWQLCLFPVFLRGERRQSDILV